MHWIGKKTLQYQQGAMTVMIKSEMEWDGKTPEHKGSEHLPPDESKKLHAGRRRGSSFSDQNDN